MILAKLNERFPQYPDLRVREIVVSKTTKKINCVVSFPDTTLLSSADRNAIFAVVKSCAPSNFYCTTVLQADVFSEVSLQKFCIERLKKMFAFFVGIKSTDVIVAKKGDRSFAVTLVLQEFLYNLALESNVVKEFSSFFAGYSCYKLSFTLQKSSVPVDFKKLVQDQEKLVQLAISKELNKPIRRFAVDDVMKYIGKKVVATPGYIVDIREPKQLATICGKISDKSIKAAKNNPNLHICKFKLTDNSGTIDCIMFVKYKITDIDAIKDTTGKTDEEVQTVSKANRLHNEKIHKQLLELYDNTEVVLDGKVVLSDYSSKLEMQVYNLSKCRILSKEEQPVYSRPVPTSYVAVAPQRIEHFEQLSLEQSQGSEVNFLVRGSYIIVNVACTGYNYLTDKIVQISATKLVDGQVVEIFDTVINPEINEIPSELKQSLNLPWDKLVYFPTLTEVVADLYKFMYGSTLVGMEVDKIANFFNYYSMPAGYKFDNKQIKLNDWFSNLFELTKKNKPNCSKLEDVAKRLNVEVPKAFDVSQKTAVSAKCVEILAKLGKN